MEVVYTKEEDHYLAYHHEGGGHFKRIGYTSFSNHAILVTVEKTHTKIQFTTTSPMRRTPMTPLSKLSLHQTTKIRPTPTMKVIQKKSHLSPNPNKVVHEALRNKTKTGSSTTLRPELMT